MGRFTSMMMGGFGALKGLAGDIGGAYKDAYSDKYLGAMDEQGVRPGAVDAFLANAAASDPATSRIGFGSGGFGGQQQQQHAPIQQPRSQQRSSGPRSQQPTAGPARNPGMVSRSRVDGRAPAGSNMLMQQFGVGQPSYFDAGYFDRGGTVHVHPHAPTDDTGNVPVMMHLRPGESATIDPGLTQPVPGPGRHVGVPPGPQYSVDQLVSNFVALESSDNYNARGASNEYGRFQYQPGTWQTQHNNWARATGEPPDQTQMDVSPDVQDEVMTHWVQSQVDAGMSPQQIASMHNAGMKRPNAYLTQGEGENRYGVKHDVGGYVNRFMGRLEGQDEGRVAQIGRPFGRSSGNSAAVAADVSRHSADRAVAPAPTLAQGAPSYLDAQARYAGSAALQGPPDLPYGHTPEGWPEGPDRSRMYGDRQGLFAAEDFDRDMKLNEVGQYVPVEGPSRFRAYLTALLSKNPMAYSKSLLSQDKVQGQEIYEEILQRAEKARIEAGYARFTTDEQNEMARIKGIYTGTPGNRVAIDRTRQFVENGYRYEQELGNDGSWGEPIPSDAPNQITAAQAQVETRMTQNRRDWETMPFDEKQSLRDSAIKETWIPGGNDALMWDQTANSQDAYQLKQFFDDHQTPTRADLASKPAYYAFDQKRQAFNKEWRRLQGRPRKGETGHVPPPPKDEDGSSDDELNKIAGGKIPMLPGMDATDYALSEEAHQAAMIEEFGKSKTITENAAGRIMEIEQEQLRYPEGSPLRQELDRKKKGLEEDARHQGEGFRKFMKDRILPDFSTGPGSRIERQGGIPGYDYDESERRAQAWKELPETIQDLPRRFGEQAEKERRERYNWLMRQ